MGVDTEMVSSGDPKFTGAVSKLVEKTGLMKPDYVAGCMMKVITECSNGTVLAITKDGTFNVPNTTTIYTLATVVINKLASKMIREKYCKSGIRRRVWGSFYLLSTLFLDILYFE